MDMKNKDSIVSLMAQTTQLRVILKVICSSSTKYVFLLCSFKLNGFYCDMFLFWSKISNGRAFAVHSRQSIQFPNCLSISDVFLIINKFFLLYNLKFSFPFLNYELQGLFVPAFWYASPSNLSSNYGVCLKFSLF